jgi:hypothetical protein
MASAVPEWILNEHKGQYCEGLKKVLGDKGGFPRKHKIDLGELDFTFNIRSAEEEKEMKELFDDVCGGE